MRFLAAISIAALIASPASADSANQFDLICTSDHHDATFHYRVDLGANAYCVTQDSGRRLTEIGGECPSRALVGVTSDVILFSQLPIQLVHRDTGEWDFKYYQSVIYRGSCAKAPFTGFPAFRTKF